LTSLDDARDRTSQQSPQVNLGVGQSWLGGLQTEVPGGFQGHSNGGVRRLWVMPS